MRHVKFVSALGLACIGGLAIWTPIAPAGADELKLPTRKAGLWELKTSMDQGGGAREQSIKMCIDDAMERQTVLASIEEHKTGCSKYHIERNGDTTSVDAECIMNKMAVSSQTKMSGDFKAAFEVTIKSTTAQSGQGPQPQSAAQSQPPQQSRAVNRTITQSGRYLDSNCGDLKPGEAMGPDGNKVMVQ
ncbi:MAG: DUF3617 family protein [Hyphomicrobiaceae bacterium]